MSKKRLSPAADRTIDIFTNKTKAEIEEAANEDIRLEPKLPETIEEASERWRRVAFQGAEWTTKLFGRPEATENQYRGTVKSGYFYLEKTGNGRTISSTGGNAYSYAGVMFPEEDLPKLATVIVGAARDYLNRKKANEERS